MANVEHHTSKCAPLNQDETHYTFYEYYKTRTVLLCRSWKSQDANFSPSSLHIRARNMSLPRTACHSGELHFFYDAIIDFCLYIRKDLYYIRYIKVMLFMAIFAKSPLMLVVHDILF